MNQKLKLLFVFGTRPEAIKMAPVILAAQQDPRIEACVVSTGQHREMLEPILKLFGIVPNYDFKLMSANLDMAGLSARITENLREPILKEKPDYILVHGDTLTCMAASLCGFLMRVPVAHVEAGLRTNDLSSPWPEEFNRRVAALAATHHFAPTTAARKNLIGESIPHKNIFVTGNTGIDAQRIVLDVICQTKDFAGRVPSNETGPMILLTVHRREAHGEPLRNILRAVVQISELRPECKIIFPVHKSPAVREAVRDVMGAKALEESDRESRFQLIEPLAYAEFLALMAVSDLILTDSGGIQEEAPSLRKPVLILRETTERPEIVEAGCGRLVGFDKERIVKETLLLLDSPSERAKMTSNQNLFGDGFASGKILNTLWNDNFASVGSDEDIFAAEA